MKAICETPFDELDELLTVEQFCRHVRIGRSTGYDLVRRNELPHVRFGHAIRIPKAALRPAQHDPKRRG